MNAHLDHGIAEVVQEAEALFDLPYTWGFGDALRTFESLDPSAALEDLLRQTLSAGPGFEANLDAGQEVPSEDSGLWSQALPRNSKKAPLPPERQANFSIPHAATPSPRTAPPKPVTVSRTESQGTRLLTGLPNLQNLFRSVVAQSQSEAEPPSREAPPPQPSLSIPPFRQLVQDTVGAKDRGPIFQRVPFLARPMTRAFDPETAVHRSPPLGSPPMASHESLPVESAQEPWHRPLAQQREWPQPSADAALRTEWSRPSADTVPDPEWSRPETTDHGPLPPRIPFPAGSATRAFAQESTPLEKRAPPFPLEAFPMTAPDPAWEDLLFDRLLDRLEERLREQAIRHLGFTGGQI